MTDQVQNAAAMYAFALVSMWLDVVDAGIKYRTNILEGKLDKQNEAKYLATLTSLWRELYPKLVASDRYNKTLETFNLYKRFYYDPKLLTLPENAEKLLEMEQLIRQALEELKITDYQG